MAHHRARRSTGIRAVSAVIGGSAIVAMAAAGMAAEHSAGGSVTAKPAMTVGATTKQTTPAKAPAVGMAKPAIKGPAPLPSEEEAAK
ncbi:hypothetical protein AU197_24190 [Mycobacterium sp. IS-1590]|uniref:hypothetical protein n=1 Tax=Mycobacterium sp. IS-1590 TaxID=1772286 RepID=UPI00074A00EA|nr:hypothetical protein [Mycobacterium sp. IS-1590]KUI43130.1 hypothetical protein AU197_24190 [Mycobacterium sp. IS-1590]